MAALSRRFRRLLAPALAVLLLPALVAALWHLTAARPRTLWTTGWPEDLICFSPDGKTLVTLALKPNDWRPGGAVRVREVDTGRERFALAPRGGGVLIVKFSTEGRLLVTMSGINDVTLWDAATGEKQAELTQPNPFAHQSVTPHFLLSGRFLLLHWEANARQRETDTLQVYDIEAKQVRKTLVGFFEDVAVAPDGTRFAVSLRDTKRPPVRPRFIGRYQGRLSSVQVWQVRPGPDGVALVKEHKLDAEELAFSRDLTTFASLAYPAGDTNPAEVQVRDLATGAVRAANKQLDLLPLIGSFGFSPDGRLLLVKCGTNQVMIARGNMPIWTFLFLDAGDGLNLALAYKGADPVLSPDGKWLALPDGAGGDLLETKHFHQHGSLRASGDQVRSLRHSPATMAFSPDSKAVIATGLTPTSIPNPLRGLRARLANSRQQFQGFKLFGPATARLWDVETGAELGSFDGCTHGLFSPDGKVLAARYEDGTVRIWDVPPRKPVGFILGLAAALWAITVGGAYLLRKAVGHREPRRSGCASRAEEAREVGRRAG